MKTEPMTAIEQRLASVWTKVLHIDVPRCEVSFVSLGGDVRSAKVTVDEIHRAFNIAVPARLLLDDGATLKHVASIIEDTLDAGALSN